MVREYFAAIADEPHVSRRGAGSVCGVRDDADPSMPEVDQVVARGDGGGPLIKCDVPEAGVLLSH